MWIAGCECRCAEKSANDECCTEFDEDNVSRCASLSNMKNRMLSTELLENSAGRFVSYSKSKPDFSSFDSIPSEYGEVESEDRVIRRFLCDTNQHLRGVPILDSIPLHRVDPEAIEAEKENVLFSLFVNGFSITSESGKECSVSLTPVSLVRSCRFAGRELKHKCFKIAYVGQERIFYFSMRDLVSDKEEEEQRSQLVLRISHAIYLLTLSLFPHFSIRCNPVPGNPATSLRLLAGYLIHQETPSCVSLMYGELRAHWDGKAELALYENEDCRHCVKCMPIDTQIYYLECLGVNCSCFCLGNQYFATRTPAERKLWLRAISNCQVKLRARAPNPDLSQLKAFRVAVREQIYRVESTTEFQISSEPLLEPFSEHRLQKLKMAYTNAGSEFEHEDFVRPLSPSGRYYAGSYQEWPLRQMPSCEKALSGTSYTSL